MSNDGFYVRTLRDGELDPFHPIYEVKGTTARCVASLVGAFDHTFAQGDKPFPKALVRAGNTLEEATAFAKRFYAGATL
jgi:hypothetical protein